MTETVEEATADPGLEQLSTQPAPPPRLEDAPTRGWLGELRAAAVYVWRQLTSMRTALLLLALLALAAVPGSLLPQNDLNPAKVSDFISTHGGWARLLNRLQAFDVFSSWWFRGIYGLLFVSLIGCLVPRMRLHARALRRRPPNAPRHLQRMSTSTSWSSDAAPGDVAAQVHAALRSRRWRADVRTEPDGAVSVAAEKGYLRETGNLVFHVALVVLLVGIAVGGLFGYKGTVLVTQGDGFADVPQAYDQFSPPSLGSTSALPPFSVQLKTFRATYQSNGEPLTYDAPVTYTTAPGAPARSFDISVNHPLTLDGASVFLVGHGYSPVIRVTDAKGTVVYDKATPFLPNDADFTSDGVIKVPDLRPTQLGLTSFFYPTYDGDPTASAYPGLKNPVLALAAWRGDLHLDDGVPQSVYTLDTTTLRSGGVTDLQPGQSWKLADGTTVTFVGVQQWATFQVVHDPGKTTVLVAAVLVIAGLLASLRVRRRRFWVRARPAGDADGPRRTVVEAAGLSRTDGEGNAEEFRELVAALTTNRET